MVYDYQMQHTEPYEWEYDLTETIYAQWSSIMKSGQPLGDWEQMGDSYESMFFYESETVMQSALEIKMMDFWLHQWSPDWQP